jgi:tetratricopeptide (TPR) repeat protein
MKHILLTLLILFAVSFSPFAPAAENASDARKHMVQGITAIEMSKNNQDLALAADEFRQATQLDPSLAAAWFNLGALQSKMGLYSAAADSYRHYLALSPKADDAQKIQDEIIKLEYRRDREKLAIRLAGVWNAPNDQAFEAQLSGTRLQLTRTKGGDDIITISAAGTHTGPMTDAPPLIFSGTLVGDKISGQYLQAAGKSSGYCEMPERSGNFEGTVDIASGQMRIVYNRVTFKYHMEFTSFFSDELVCTPTDRQVTPNYVLELKQQTMSAPASSNASGS